MPNNYNELEKLIGYSFKDKSHLDIAFTHKSYTNENMVKKHQSYERYEFLGDAILEFLVSDYLYNEYPNKPEGELTKLRASIVCEFTLSGLARELKLGQYGYFSKGERNTGGNNRDSILCDMFESLLGAIYLDGGLEYAKAFVKNLLLTDIDSKKLYYDSKTSLQEYVQKNGKILEYKVVKETGPEHNKEYTVELLIDNKLVSSGIGHSKKTAEQNAAYQALTAINN
ncbi:MAG: ribonuclease III [Lachnospiraceae bacterium]|nr:ribonuclease III [Lachnospiraceae bacterium]MBQ8318468.1 ribonuclease III [Lachnospiraceae bacterium]